MSKLADFLNKNSISSPALGLPYVHSTKSYNLEDIIKSNRLSARFCNEFKEDLLYFFRGRPAYKQDSDGQEASYWQLPTCFIYSQLPTTKIKRTLPFDSGAFKQGRYPEYIGFMPIDEFTVEGTDASNRIVEAFFGDLKNYLRGSPKSELDIADSYQITAFDAEVLAVRRLAADGTPKTFDDRRFTIEIQCQETVNLNQSPPTAVILPLTYMDDSTVRNALATWKAKPITYDVHAQSLELYFSVIFQKFMDHLRDEKVI